MRITPLFFSLALLASCASPATQHSWELRLSRYVVGDDARPLISALDSEHYPVRYIPTHPMGEGHILYFIPTGEVHVMTKMTDAGKTVISTAPFFVADDSPVSERLARCDKEWNDYVKKHTNH